MARQRQTRRARVPAGGTTDDGAQRRAARWPAKAPTYGARTLNARHDCIRSAPNRGTHRDIRFRSIARARSPGLAAARSHVRGRPVSQPLRRTCAIARSRSRSAARTRSPRCAPALPHVREMTPGKRKRRAVAQPSAACRCRAGAARPCSSRFGRRRFSALFGAGAFARLLLRAVLRHVERLQDSVATPAPPQQK